MSILATVVHLLEIAIKCAALHIRMLNIIFTKGWLVNKLIRKIFSKKRYAYAMAVLLVAIASSTIYILTGVSKNVQIMAAAANQSPTYFPDYPPTNTAGKDPILIKRGEYIAKAGDCIACHTNTYEKGPTFAGGLPMTTPFGTIYSPNITPDKETGIGRWTEAQFIKAMHKGISPQGHYYYPAFPYYYFSKITIEDLKALKAYLDSIPAVHLVNRNNEMIKPFNARMLQLGWRVLFFHPKDTGVFKPDPNQSAEWNRGNYLVEGPGHCAMCHSPSYYMISEKIPLGAPIRKYDLTGARIQGYLAPNITKANLLTISTEEVARVFTEDRLIGGGQVEGPMLEVNHDSLKQLSPSDLDAIATYLKTVVSKTPPKPKAGAGGPGGSLYESYCSGCHATGAGGAPKLGDTTAWDERMVHGGMDKMYANAIHGLGGMPAKGTCLSCSEQEIKQAVDYMMAFAKGGSVKLIASAPKLKQLSMADGKRLYEKNCSTCHASGKEGAPRLGDKKAWQTTINAGFIDTYVNVVTGRKGHLPRGACPQCTDGELKAAIKYMMQQGTTTNNYELW